MAGAAAPRRARTSLPHPRRAPSTPRPDKRAATNVAAVFRFGSSTPSCRQFRLVLWGQFEYPAYDGTPTPADRESAGRFTHGTAPAWIVDQRGQCVTERR